MRKACKQLTDNEIERKHVRRRQLCGVDILPEETISYPSGQPCREVWEKVETIAGATMPRGGRLHLA